MTWKASAGEIGKRSVLDDVTLCIAQGLYVGRIPVTPGSFGSLLGLFWVALLLWPGRVWFYACGALLGIGASVWICGRAETLLGTTDPGSVVLDEIAAMPVCFAAWIAIGAFRIGHLPGPQSFLSVPSIWWTLAIFLGFRFFDILKPWPVRQSQALPGGWGVTIDDVLAAVYVNLGVLLAWVLLRS